MQKKISSFTFLFLCALLILSHTFLLANTTKENLSITDFMTTIEKPLTDDRSYECFTLPNNLQVLLISDPDTDKAAAAMDVHVGHFSDPEEVPGLAHFCEHMLFLGTEKYPEEGTYQEFIKKHGGNTNAYTDTENTNYFFDVKKDKLEEALDRFAQFFVAPLFTQAATEREMKAVHSEHQKNLQSDMWRFFQLLKSTANPEHPFHKFGTGDLETLLHTPLQKGVDVRKALLDFHDKYYAPNMMKLVVLGKEPLEVLKSWVEKMFSEIPTREASRDTSFDTVPAFSKQELGKIYQIVPVRDIKTINVYFPLPSPTKDYLYKPTRYYGHLLGHESTGSIFAYLKEKGWATSLYSGSSYQFTEQEVFSVSVELTDEGEKHCDEILDYIFQYIQLLKQNKVQKWIFDEVADLETFKFKFAEKQNPFTYVSSLAKNMHKYKTEHLIGGGSLFYEYNPSLIDQVLQFLNPENLIIHKVGKIYEETASQQETWYKTKYSVENISQEQMQKWNAIDLNEHFALPPHNEFIPTNFDVLPANDSEEIPTLIVDTPLCKLWFKQDKTFKRPTVSLNYRILTPSQSTAHGVVLSNIFCNIVKDELNAFAYLAEVAGLSYTIDNIDTEGIEIRIGGFSHKINVLKSIVFAKIANPELKQERFEVVKERLQRQFRNMVKEQPYAHCILDSCVALREKHFALQDLLESVESVTYGQFKEVVPSLLLSLQLRALYHGNLNQEEAIASIKEVQDLIGQGKLAVRDEALPFTRVVQLKNNGKTDYVFQRETLNEGDTNSAVEIIYQISSRDDTKLEMLLELFVQINSAPYFEQLRTQEQLGYLVFSRKRIDFNVVSYSLIIQSSEKNANYLLERSDLFMKNQIEKLNSLSEEEFEHYKAAVISVKTEPDKRMSKETARYWEEIKYRMYLFRRRFSDAEVLQQITKEELIKFVEQFLLPNGEQCVRLVTQVFAKRFWNETELKNQLVTQLQEFGRVPVFINDPTSFRLQNNLYSYSHLK